MRSEQMSLCFGHHRRAPGPSPRRRESSHLAGRTAGGLGDPRLDALVTEDARGMLAAGRTGTVRYSPDGRRLGDGVTVSSPPSSHHHGCWCSGRSTSPGRRPRSDPSLAIGSPSAMAGVRHDRAVSSRGGGRCRLTAPIPRSGDRRKSHRRSRGGARSDP
ncbi:XdhC family protein [Kribbella sp. NPDC051620]|uniref:XdhC family protein n=1 Tax=Kribbella sp. NPDC051620 TaxID=3364120 RepID=UPI00378816A1